MPAPFTTCDILGALPQAVVAVDADGRVTTVNPAGLALFGPQAVSETVASPMSRWA